MMANGRSIRFAPSLACAAACLALLRPAPLLAGERTEIAPGQWVRVTTGPEVSGEGCAMSLSETHGNAVSHDKRTTTFDIGGRLVRLPKPGTTVEGNIQAAGPDRLLLTRTGESTPIVVPRAAISRLDVRQRGSRRGIGALIGAVAGGAIGYAIGAAQVSSDCKAPRRDGPQGYGPLFDFVCDLNQVRKPAGAGLGVAGGAILGVLVAPGAKWEKNVSLDRVRLSLSPTRDHGVALSLSLAF